MNNILVVCKIQDEILKKYTSQIIYKPHLAEFTEPEWEEFIKSINPDVVLFGTIHFTREMMKIWREYKPTSKLSIVRKGISLGRCDLNAAKEYSIDVFNLPGVNSLFVVNFMKKYLFEENKPTDVLSVIGIGSIGQRVIQEAVKQHVAILLHSKTLKTHEGLKKKLWFNALPATCSVNIATTLEQAFAGSTKIAISIPYNPDTKGIVKEKHINRIPRGALLVSVSEPKIFSDDALRALYDRTDIFVVIDHLATEFNDLYNIIGSNYLRENFLLLEDAATSIECQQAMSLAAIEKCLSIEN